MNLQQFRYYTEWHDFVNKCEYDAPADPWKLLPVALDDVTYYTREIRLNWGLGWVIGGDWDSEENCNRLRETTTYRGLKQRFEEGYDWEDTALYRRAKQRFETSSTVRGYDSIGEHRNVRCEYIDELYHSIRRNGYRPNVEAEHDNPHEDAYAHKLEPLVVIGRSGEVYWAEGYHRFAIASILDIDAIPVYVLCRHETWQHVRDRIHTTPVSELPPEFEAFLGHPDIATVGS